MITQSGDLIKWSSVYSCSHALDDHSSTGLGCKQQFNHVADYVGCKQSQALVGIDVAVFSQVHICAIVYQHDLCGLVIAIGGISYLHHVMHSPKCCCRPRINNLLERASTGMRIAVDYPGVAAHIPVALQHLYIGKSAYV